MRARAELLKYDTPVWGAAMAVDEMRDGAGAFGGLTSSALKDQRISVNGYAKVADGPNGPVMPQVTRLLPEAPIVHRPGEINAFDNPEFVAAVAKTDRKELIVAGISTEVCVAFVALSALKLGYEVFAVIDSSGTWSKLVQEGSIARMVQAGVVPMTWRLGGCLGSHVQEADYAAPTARCRMR